MFGNGHPRTQSQRSVVGRLRAVRTYLHSVHAACLQPAYPRTGYVLLIEDAQQCPGLAPGGYTLVARMDEWALLCPIRLSPRGELEYSDRLIKVRYTLLRDDAVVGRESMIIPE